MTHLHLDYIFGIHGRGDVLLDRSQYTNWTSYKYDLSSTRICLSCGSLDLPYLCMWVSLVLSFLLLHSMRSYTWFYRVLRIDPLPDCRRQYEGWSHPILRSGCNSTSTASVTKDCTRASAPATLVRNFFAAARQTPIPFRLPILSVIFATPTVSSIALLLYHHLSRRSWICLSAHWDTYLYMGWLANAGRYILYRLSRCRYQCRCVGDRFVGSGTGVIYRVPPIYRDSLRIPTQSKLSHHGRL